MVAGYTEQQIKYYQAGHADGGHAYICGHCGHKTAGRVVSGKTVNKGGSGPLITRFMLCTGCGNGSVENNNNITPGIRLGSNLEGLPQSVEVAYNEARDLMAICAYTSCELICRKILLHIAVDKGSKEDISFEQCMEHLEKEGYITVTIKPWADLIRKHGNKSTHRLEAPDENRAKATFTFTEQLLKIVYEMEHIAKKHIQVTPNVQVSQ